MSKDKTLKESVNSALRKADVRHFCFKVNNSKLQDEFRLKNQIEKVVKRLVERNNIRSESVELFFGTVNDDFVFDRCRLRISFNERIYATAFSNKDKRSKLTAYTTNIHLPKQLMQSRFE